jgi:ribosomal protein S18 acetylase RimI-like enzyme
MKSLFRIQRVDITDALVRAHVSALHLECFGPDDNPYVPTKGAWWIAFCDKEEAGFAGISESYQVHGRGYLCRAGVLPKFRGMGLQVKLIRKRIDYAKKQDWTSVVTDTYQNPASSNSLIKCGFKLFEPTYPWGFTNALYWRKAL